MHLSRIFRIGIFIFLLCSFLNIRNVQAEFLGAIPTGLSHSEEDAFGYSYYVPTNYKADRVWPLVVAFHDAGGTGKEYIQGWIDLAEQRGVIVLCPTYEEPRDIPYDLDKRNLRIVEKMTERYEIDLNRILVMGTGFGGHYAIYFGLKYPRQFSTGVASIGNGFQGALEKILSFSYAKTNQPFLLILADSKDAEWNAETDRKLKFYKDKGYSIEVVDVDMFDKEKTQGFYSHILDWFDEAAPKRQREMVPSRSFKQGFLRLIDQIS